MSGKYSARARVVISAHYFDVCVCVCVCVCGGGYTDSPHPVAVTAERILADGAVALARIAPNFTAMVCFLFLALLAPNSPVMRAGPIFGP